MLISGFLVFSSFRPPIGQTGKFVYCADNIILESSGCAPRVSSRNLLHGSDFAIVCEII